MREVQRRWPTSPCQGSARAGAGRGDTDELPPCPPIFPASPQHKPLALFLPSSPIFTLHLVVAPSPSQCLSPVKLSVPSRGGRSPSLLGRSVLALSSTLPSRRHPQLRRKQWPQFDAEADFRPLQNSKVTVLGAAGGIGQPLSLLLKLNPRVTELALYDIRLAPGTAPWRAQTISSIAVLTCCAL